MKATPSGGNHEETVTASPSPSEPEERLRPSLSLEYRNHADFVWRSLQRLGLRPSELNDALQEVFLVAHRRLDEFDDGRAKFSTWLFGIAVRVAWTFRRKRSTEALNDLVLVDAQTPESIYEHRESVRRLHAALERLTPELRATFVMFELEGESCTTIASVFDVPVGTVYSRLHKARQFVKAEVEGTSAREWEASP